MIETVTRRLTAQDVLPNAYAFKVACTYPEDVVTQIVEEFARLRRWDLDPTVFAVAPYDRSMTALPVRWRGNEASDGTPTWAVVAILTHEVPGSLYHNLVGITIENVTGVVLVQEAYMGTYVEGDARPMADRVESQEVRIAMFMGLDGESKSASQVRGAPAENGAFMVGGGIPLLLKRLVGATVEEPEYVTSPLVLFDQLRLEFPFEHPDGLFAGAFHGEPAETILPRLENPLNQPVFDGWPGRVQVLDLCDFVRVPEDAPPIPVTGDVVDWLSPAGLWELIYGKEEPVPVAEVEGGLREIWARERFGVYVADHNDEAVAGLLDLAAKVGFPPGLEIAAPDRIAHLGLAVLQLGSVGAIEMGAPAWLQKIAFRAERAPLKRLPERLQQVRTFLDVWQRRRADFLLFPVQ